MEKKDQLLIIDPPAELKFRGPFTKPIINIMTLKNPTDHTILFKIKTTAPRKYCVRPNFGAVEPQSSTDVEICLQSNFSFDINEKNKHKFMVQSFVVPEGATDHSKLWKEIQPEQLMDSKLRCVFEMPSETPAGDFIDNSRAQNDPAPNESTLPKAINEDMSKDQAEHIRVTTEVRKLRQNESQLRQENLKLQEELLRLRMTTEANQKEQPTSLSSQYQNPYSPPQLGEQPVPIMYIAIAVVMAIFGLLLGKYLL